MDAAQAATGRSGVGQMQVEARPQLPRSPRPRASRQGSPQAPHLASAQAQLLVGLATKGQPLVMARLEWLLTLMP